MKKLLIWLTSIITTIVLAVAGVFLFVKIQYDINLFETIKQVSIVAQEVNPEEKYTNMFSDADMESAKQTVNAVVPDLILYSAEQGYSINSSVSDMMSGDLKLTSKQLGAVLNMMLLNGEAGLTFNIAGNELPVSLVQIQLQSLQEQSADFNVVVKVDITSLKAKMSSFPFNLIVGKIPNSIYVSSTITLTKGEQPFEYSVVSKSLEINNLDAKGTESLLKAINTFVQFGTVQELNSTIAGNFAGATIGSETSDGFAYSLKPLGATDFDFEILAEDVLFVVKK